MTETTDLPPLRYDMQSRRVSRCQASEDDCDYAQCPRWRDGKLISEAHCALDLIPGDEDA